MRIPSLDLEQGEGLRAEVFANLFRGWESVGGRLSVTDRRIRFESHAWNVQVGPSEIRFDEIASVRPCNTFWVIPNGLRVETSGGKVYRFVVCGPDRLARLIHECLSERGRLTG